MMLGLIHTKFEPAQQRSQEKNTGTTCFFQQKKPVKKTCGGNRGGIEFPLFYIHYNVLKYSKAFSKTAHQPAWQDGWHGQDPSNKKGRRTH